MYWFVKDEKVNKGMVYFLINEIFFKKSFMILEK